MTSEKPHTITRSMNAIWASLAIGCLKVLLDLNHIRAEAPLVVVLVVFGVTVAAIAFLTVKMSAGRNWARITFVVLYVIGILPTIPIVMSELGRSPLLGILGGAQIALQFYAILLTFMPPGKSWFAKRAVARDDALV